MQSHHAQTHLTCIVCDMLTTTQQKWCVAALSKHLEMISSDLQYNLIQMFERHTQNTSRTINTITRYHYYVLIRQHG